MTFDRQLFCPLGRLIPFPLKFCVMHFETYFFTSPKSGGFFFIYFSLHDIIFLENQSLLQLHNYNVIAIEFIVRNYNFICYYCMLHFILFC